MVLHLCLSVIKLNTLNTPLSILLCCGPRSFMISFSADMFESGYLTVALLFTQQS